MPKELDKLKNKIWAELKGKINPKTKKPYTENEAWAIATDQWKKAGRQLSFSLEEIESEPNIVENTIRALERGEGMGQGGPRQGDGGADVCICPKCGYKLSHQRGIPCNEMKCPKCKVSLVGSEQKQEKKESD